MLGADRTAETCDIAQYTLIDRLIVSGRAGHLDVQVSFCEMPEREHRCGDTRSGRCREKGVELMRWEGDVERVDHAQGDSRLWLSLAIDPQSSFDRSVDVVAELGHLRCLDQQVVRPTIPEWMWQARHLTDQAHARVVEVLDSQDLSRAGAQQQLPAQAPVPTT